MNDEAPTKSVGEVPKLLEARLHIFEIKSGSINFTVFLLAQRVQEKDGGFSRHPFPIMWTVRQSFTDTPAFRRELEEATGVNCFGGVYPGAEILVRAYFRDGPRRVFITKFMKSDCPVWTAETAVSKP